MQDTHSATDPDTSPPPQPPTCTALFIGFLEIGLYGFGGVGATARFIIVDKRHWLSAQDYLAFLSVGQVLPGGNVVNSAVMIGDHFRGLQGAAAAMAGLLLAPLVILVGIGVLHNRYGDLPIVQAMAAGGGAAAAGMIIGTGLRLARDVTPTLANVALGVLGVVTLGVLRVPLPAILIVLLPLSIGYALWRRRA